MFTTPKIKICGITNLKDIELVSSSGADYAGILLNVAASSRSVDGEKAESLCRKARIPIVVLLWQPTFKEIEIAYNRLKPYAFQLLSQEEPELVTEIKSKIPDVMVWKSIHLPSSEQGISQGIDINIGDMRTRIEAYIDSGVDVILIDTVYRSNNGIQHGGTGKISNWNTVVELFKNLDVPLFLAGGITPSNVKDAINQVNPYGIDVASGVEKEKGIKDPVKVRELIKIVRRIEEHG
ncbi:MAG: phosphoribosylanthranilate isomerase [bacterium]|nr:phosphoribosylanthranilate isomerase [bacterium]